jgi:hypothetical protein
MSTDLTRAFNHHRRMVRDYNESVYAPCPLTEDRSVKWPCAALVTAAVCIAANYWWFA